MAPSRERFSEGIYVSDHGTLEAIWIKRMRRGPMDPRDSVRAIAGKGLEGNASRSRYRQVTLIEAERWADACEELGAEVDPGARRANLLVRGFDLAAARGRVIAVGDVRLRLLAETRPCYRMDEAHPGLERALQADVRGGVYGQVLDDGEIAVGEPVRPADDEAGD